MREQLKYFYNQFEEIEKRAEEIIDNLSDGQLNMKPSPDRWSILQQINHIAVSTEVYLEKINSPVKIVNLSNKSDSEYRPGLLGKYFVKLLEPPVKKRLKTFPIFKPKNELTGKLVMNDFIAVNEKIKNTITGMENIDLNKSKIMNPLIKFIKWRLGDAFQICAAHSRRHLWLSEQIKNSFRE
ncbi:MAG: DinB family protein [Melioribacteraceae bacterium]|nr:DinB family protein [Melioribacteraceae bacterium]MCF8353861.1 DinB family protein [Melioribacteraceae bacterium]MCF8393094.1 DinB family protein [Melioribacteraceae bacterium]MCF8419213.1 DinB family protein [Melioribacteraceae bacterium]